MRLPARAYSMPLADEGAALSDDIEPVSPHAMSLNGKWKFKWVGDPRRRPANFWVEGYDVSKWNEIDVPSCVEMKGYGSPGYTNVRYPHKCEWPKILDRLTGRNDYNPVSSYRREFEVPESWKGRRIILRFDGVYSAYYAWVNGVEVGYAEDSKLPSEFDVTKHVKFGAKNSISVQVFRWCDGSYLEGQDMIRYSGIFRDVTLWSMPEGGVWDFIVRTKPLDGTYAAWRIDVAATNVSSVALYGADKKKVADLQGVGNGLFSADLNGISPWSAEKPCLYTLVIKGAGRALQSRMPATGAASQAMRLRSPQAIFSASTRVRRRMFRCQAILP